MPQDMKVSIKIAADTKEGREELAKMLGEFKKTSDGVKKEGGGLLSSIFGSVGNMAAMAGGALVAGAVKLNSDFENYMTQFEVMLGSAEKGAAMFEQIKQMGAKTPFETADLAKATQTMLSFGAAQEDILPNLQMLGDISGGNAEKLSSLTLAYSQVQSTGRLMGQDLLQMINQGFNPLQVISEKTGKSMAELKKEMENGAISADMVRDAMKTATSEGGKFFGMMDKQSKTFEGMMSTLMDNMKELLRVIGGPIFDILKKLLAQVIGILNNPTVQSALAKIGEAFGKILNAFGPIIEKLTNALAPIIVKLAEFISRLADALKPVIDVYLKILIDNMDVMLPLISSILDLLIALMPAIQVMAPMVAEITTAGIRLSNMVITPLIRAITFIIEKGAAAAEWVRKIFGGGESESRIRGKLSEQFAGGDSRGEAVPDMPFAPLDSGAPGKGKKGETKEQRLKRLRQEDEVRQQMAKDAWDRRVALEDQMRAREKAAAEEHADYIYNENMRVHLAYVQQKREEAEIFLANQEAERLAAEARSQYYVDSTGAILSNLGQVFEGSKEIAAASAIISTYEGASKALAQGGFFGFGMAAAVIAAGLANVAKIYATTPGSGAGGGGSSAQPSVNMSTARIPAMTTGGGVQGLRIGGEFKFQDGALRAAISHDTTVQQQATL